MPTTRDADPRAASTDPPGLVALCRQAEEACERYRREQLRQAGYPDLRRELIPLLRSLAAGDRTIGELATALGITVHDAAQRVGLLETRSYAHRLGAAGDIRLRLVQITAAGRAATELDRRLEADLEQQVSAQVGIAHTAAARQVLAALRDSTRSREHAAAG